MVQREQEGLGPTRTEGTSGCTCLASSSVPDSLDPSPSPIRSTRLPISSNSPHTTEFILHFTFPYLNLTTFLFLSPQSLDQQRNPPSVNPEGWYRLQGKRCLGLLAPWWHSGISCPLGRLWSRGSLMAFQKHHSQPHTANQLPRVSPSPHCTPCKRLATTMLGSSALKSGPWRGGVLSKTSQALHPDNHSTHSHQNTNHTHLHAISLISRTAT